MAPAVVRALSQAVVLLLVLDIGFDGCTLGRFAARCASSDKASNNRKEQWSDFHLASPMRIFFLFQAVDSPRVSRRATLTTREKHVWRSVVAKTGCVTRHAHARSPSFDDWLSDSRERRGRGFYRAGPDSTMYPGKSNISDCRKMGFCAMRDVSRDALLRTTQRNGRVSFRSHLLRGLHAIRGSSGR